MATSRRLVGGLHHAEPALSRAEVFDLLSNRRRRGVIRYLRGTDGSVELESVIDAVVAWETGGSPDAVTESQRASVYSSLLQTHLPRLEEAGVVVLDREAGTVEPTDRTREVELYLEYAPKAAIPWAEYYLGLAAVSAAALAVVWAGLPPFDTLPLELVAAGVVAVLGVSAIVHLVETRRSRLGGEPLERTLDAE